MHTDSKMIKHVSMALILLMGGMAIAGVPIVQHRFHYFGELTGDENVDNLLRLSKTNEAVKVTEGIISNGREFVEYYECSPVYTRNKVDYYYERELFKSLGEDGQMKWSYHPDGDAKKTWTGTQVYMCGHIDSIKQGDERFVLTKGISTGQFYMLHKFWNELSRSKKKFDKAVAKMLALKYNTAEVMEFRELMFDRPRKAAKFKFSFVGFHSGMEPYLPPHYDLELENIDQELDRWVIHFDFVDDEVEILLISKPRL